MPSITIAGREVLIDEADAHILDGAGWTIRMSGRTSYVQRKIYRDGRYAGVEHLHRLIVGCGEDFSVDHINGSGLDNRRENLRRCTQAENTRNRRRHSSNRSGYKGVYLSPRNTGEACWRAQIRVDGKKISLGRHDTAEAAYAAYCAASKRFHGEFSRIA
jgi:hypothetical protein